MNCLNNDHLLLKNFFFFIGTEHVKQNHFVLNETRVEMKELMSQCLSKLETAVITYKNSVRQEE